MVEFRTRDFENEARGCVDVLEEEAKNRGTDFADLMQKDISGQRICARILVDCRSELVSPCAHEEKVFRSRRKVEGKAEPRIQRSRATIDGPRASLLEVNRVGRMTERKLE